MNWITPFFGSLDSVYMSVVTAVLVYPLLIGLVRLFGKRSTSKMNNFDWIVTVAIGALAASAIGFEEVTLLDALVTIVVLLSMQWALTKWMVRSEAVEEAVQEDATLLVFRGRVVDPAMVGERVTEKEMNAAIRQAGLTDISEVYALILESNAKFSVIENGTASLSDSALAEFTLPPDFEGEGD